MENIKKENVLDPKIVEAVAAIKKILGHSSHSVTERYAHLSSKSLMDAANTASDRIKGATTEKKAATTEVATAAVEEEVRAAA